MYRRKSSDPLDLRYIECTVKQPDIIMVWGCFSALGPEKLVMLPPIVIVNAEIYMDLLADHDSFELTGAHVFQQDGATQPVLSSIECLCMKFPSFTIGLATH